MMGGQTTGVPAVDTLAAWSVAAAAIAGLAALGWRLLRGWRRIEKGVDQVVEDWRGTPARPGVPARPGMMERMSTLEDTSRQVDRRLGSVEQHDQEIDRRLRLIEHEMHPNGGSSFRDAIDRVDRRTARIAPDNDGT